jgi:hypothetical protein
MKNKNWNNIKVPFNFEAELKRQAELRARAQQIQDDCNHILEQDEQFITTARIVRDRFTSGMLKMGEYRAIIKWHVAACLRRAGLPLRIARVYQSLSVFSL